MLTSEIRKQIQTGNPGVVLTGAGISVPSGLPSFRGANGLYADKIPPFLEYQYYLNHPDESWQGLVKLFHQSAAAVKPNPAHHALTTLQKNGIIDAIITQNVDMLHQRAGSTNVLELHGSVGRMGCTRCHFRFDADIPARINDPALQKCPQCGSLCKPDIVLFGENLDEKVINQSLAAIHAADWMLIVGTSAAVYPAAQLPIEFKNNGGLVIEINTEPSELTQRVTDIFLQGPCEKILPELVMELQQTK